MPPVRQYTEEVHQALSYWATWLPNVAIGVGDCGPIDGRVFRPEATLGDFGVKFSSKRGNKPLDLHHSSQGAVSYTLQLSAGNQTIPQIPQGTAGIEISFSKQDAVVLVVREAYEHRIANINTLRKDLFDRQASGDFPTDYAVVTHAVVAESTTVLLSSAHTAKFAASAKADFKAGLVDIANAELGLSRVAGSNLETEIVAKDGLTPLFKLVGFKRNGWFWGSRRFEDLGFDDDVGGMDLGSVEPSDTDPEE